MIDKNDESLEVLFSGYLIKYTMVFNEIKRSNYGKGSDAFHNILENKGELPYLPTGNGCFRKCIEHTYKRAFSIEHKEFISDSDKCKNIMTLAKVQPFCRAYGFDIGVYNLNSIKILSWTVKEKNICLFLRKNPLLFELEIIKAN